MRLALLAGLLCACCGPSLRGKAGLPDDRLPRVAVAPVAFTARVRSWGAVSNAPMPADEAVGIAATASSAAASVRLDLEKALADTGRFEVVQDTASADLVLDAEVSSYGRIKGRWLSYILGTSVVEGVAKGVLVAQVGSVWLAAGVAAEELAEEVVEYGGGAYLFARYFTPVTLEARVSARGKKLWSKVAFDARNRKALKAEPEERRKDRALRLALTARKAAEEVAEGVACRFGKR